MMKKAPILTDEQITPFLSTTDKYGTMCAKQEYLLTYARDFYHDYYTRQTVSVEKIREILDKGVRFTWRDSDGEHISGRQISDEAFESMVSELTKLYQPDREKVLNRIREYQKTLIGTQTGEDFNRFLTVHGESLADAICGGNNES